MILDPKHLISSDSQWGASRTLDLAGLVPENGFGQRELNPSAVRVRERDLRFEGGRGRMQGLTLSVIEAE